MSDASLNTGSPTASKAYKSEPQKTSLLIILDGWGHSDSTDSNAISAAQTPTWDTLWNSSPHTLISGSGRDVGLPDGQMGNSEVGHMNLGAGRVVDQDLTRISNSIKNGSFRKNPVLLRALNAAQVRNSAVHILGLLSPGGVHSHEQHIQGMIEMARANGNQAVHVHAFLDGRDTPPRSAEASIGKLEETLKVNTYSPICSITGRYFAMDRDNRWDRVKRAYDLLTTGKADFHANSAQEALALAYARNENDEFVTPTAIHKPGQAPVTIEDEDVLIFMNFRADRARQISRAFTEPDFSAFTRERIPSLAQYVTLTRYAEEIDAQVAFDSEQLDNTFGEYISKLGYSQLRIAETEKYAHVTFFFSGGRESPFKGESRCLIPSPDVATYDLKPEMSAKEVTDQLVDAINDGTYNVIVCNYANGDMVGHTGILNAAIQAVETLDTCLARIVAAIRHTGSQCLITADHGNVERMNDTQSGQAHTAHTNYPVPLIYVGPSSKEASITLNTNGSLSDVAPTLLDLMNVDVPQEMSGHSLINRKA